VRLVYWGRDNGPEFDLLDDGTIIATAALQATGKDEYHGVEYPIPAELSAGKNTLVVRVQAKPGKPAASIYDLRIVTTK
jgi:hypothetical protein